MRQLDPVQDKTTVTITTPYAHSAIVENSGDLDSVDVLSMLVRAAVAAGYHSTSMEDAIIVFADSINRKAERD